MSFFMVFISVLLYECTTRLQTGNTARRQTAFGQPENRLKPKELFPNKESSSLAKQVEKRDLSKGGGTRRKRPKRSRTRKCKK